MSDDSVTVSQPVNGQFQMWGSLEILQEIGRGGFGVVYRAWEPTLAREVALKVIRPRDAQPETLASILREGQLLARVRHPSVVTVYGAQQIGDEVGLWMELVRGRSLSDLVKHDGPRAAAEAAVIGISLCQATAAVHQAGVIHRDIKAHNVMRESGGRIVLMDFGAGQMLEAPRNPEDRAIGTPAYMAPEVLAGGRATARSDIYSLGVLLYYLVTGAYPVEGNTWTDFLLAHARYQRRPLGDVRPDIHASFVRVVERATALNPDDRYPSPGAMLADLGIAATGRVSTERRAARTDSRRRPASPRLRRAKAPDGTAPRTPHPALRRAAEFAVPLLLPLVLGAITSGSFNHTLGRSAEYSQENIVTWWIWGVRALIPGAVQATVVVLLWSLTAAMWKVLTRVSTPAARLAESLRTRRSAFAARVGLHDPETAAHALLAAQILAVGAFCWYFRDLFSASISFIDTAIPADIEPLRPDHLTRHQLYNLSMAMLILAMSVAASQIVKMARNTGATLRPPVKRAMSLVLLVIGVSFVILVYPYRLIWQNEFEMAGYHGSSCYLLGEHAANALLYCPGDPAPKVREVALADKALERSGKLQNIYTR